MDIEIRGAKILYTIHTGLIDLNITQTLVMSWVVMALITGLCIWLGHGLKVENISRRQALAEMIVEALDNFVRTNMGPKFDRYIPLVGALFASSIVSNLISITGVWSPTADLSTEGAWAIVVFVLITYYKIKTDGIGGYLKGYLSPIFIMAPINVISEFATPVSMACRHFGNILSGMVISTLIYGALAAASYALIGLLGSSLVAALIVLVVGAFVVYKGVSKVGKNGKKGSTALKILGGVLVLLALLGLLGQVSAAANSVLTGIPLLEVGIPAMTGLYFDWFSGCIQAFIFCTLTTIFIKQAAGEA